MGVTMHVKSDSEVTSIGASTPPRPLYYVQSPSHSQQDLEKMSYGSSPFGSPTHHFHYHCSPIHHSRESSTSRFSASLKNPRHSGGVGGEWRRLQRKFDEASGEEEGGEEGESEDEREEDGGQVRFYVACFLLSFAVLFSIFSLILWAASLAYKPRIIVKNILFENLYVQAGMDDSGVPTDMLTLNSTVKIFYRNPATFFGVHVTSTPVELHYFDLKVASGHIKKFYQSRKSERKVVAVVQGRQMPLYGGIPALTVARGRIDDMLVPLNLTFVIRSRAYILGRLVKPKFYRKIRCNVTLGGSGLGKPLNLIKSESCIHH